MCFFRILSGTPAGFIVVTSERAVAVGRPEGCSSVWPIKKRMWQCNTHWVRPLCDKVQCFLAIQSGCTRGSFFNWLYFLLSQKFVEIFQAWLVFSWKWFWTWKFRICTNIAETKHFWKNLVFFLVLWVCGKKKTIFFHIFRIIQNHNNSIFFGISIFTKEQNHAIWPFFISDQHPGRPLCPFFGPCRPWNSVPPFQEL